ncbi:MAG: 4a-hydroxytetrahydrobiopterin dehydratase [Candidatus Coatesbacteria bacterium]
MKTKHNGAGGTTVALPGWTRTPDGLTKTFVQPNFRAAVALVNWIAELAEAMDHHPDIRLHDYKRLTVTIITHSPRAITEKDYELAERIEHLGSA